MAENYVIVGAGHASGQAVASLRQAGFDGKITLIGEEPYLPYQRPPLSKAYLAGEIGIDRVYFKPPEFYDTVKADVHLNTKVTAMDRAARTVTTEAGETVAYDKLMIATGGRVRKLQCPGADLDGVTYLRTVDDVETIKKYFGPGKKVVIVGAGYIGLEVAAVARKHDLSVTVLEMEPRVLARVTSPEMSDFFHGAHTGAGVNICYGQGATSFVGDGTVSKVVTQTGDEYEADLVVVGIGIIPNVEFAQEAGITCDNGIVVDEFCRTNDEHVFAVGDCTNHPNKIYGRRIRLESVHNAIEQAKTAANAMTGTLKEYNQVPWFWSDQYDLKLQIAGLSTGYDQVVLRGNPADRKFSAFYLKEGVLIAVDAINSAPEFMLSKKLITNRAKLDPAKIADTSLSMKEVAANL